MQKESRRPKSVSEGATASGTIANTTGFAQANARLARNVPRRTYENVSNRCTADSRAGGARQTLLATPGDWGPHQPNAQCPSPAQCSGLLPSISSGSIGAGAGGASSASSALWTSSTASETTSCVLSVFSSASSTSASFSCQILLPLALACLACSPFPLQVP